MTFFKHFGGDDFAALSTCECHCPGIVYHIGFLDSREESWIQAGGADDAAPGVVVIHHPVVAPGGSFYHHPVPKPPTVSTAPPNIRSEIEHLNHLRFHRYYIQQHRASIFLKPCVGLICSAYVMTE